MSYYTETEQRNSHSNNNLGEVKRVVRLFEESFGRTTRIATRTFVLDRYSLRIKRIVGDDGGWKASGQFDRFGRVGDVFNRPSSRPVVRTVERVRVVERTETSGSVAVGAAAGLIIGSIIGAALDSDK